MNDQARVEGFVTGERFFADGEWFQAHEVWEELWHELVGEKRQFVQALIQAAVALHHQSRGNGTGAWNLAQRVEHRLNAATANWYGVDRAKFLVEFHRAMRGFGQISEQEMRAGAPVPSPIPFAVPHEV